jgi:opacity protein-like surface antigen
MSAHLRQGFGGQAPFTLVLAFACVTALPAGASAQGVSIRGFGDVGLTRFAAADTFKATLGSSTGGFFGGGVEVVLAQRFFFNLRISRLQKTGERVFVDGDEVFPLGIELKVGLRPVEVSGGYRFRSRGNVIPFVGGGVGWHRYSEESDFAQAGEDVNETFTGYHALGGVEYRLSRWFGAAGEAQWTTIRDALGSGLTSASEVYGESNLGGFGVRVRFVVGR